MRDIDSNKLQDLYESILTEKFSDPASEKKAKELEDSKEEEKDTEEVAEEDSEEKGSEGKEHVVTPEKEDRIKKFEARKKLAPKGHPSKVITKGGNNFASIQSRKGTGKEPGWGIQPYDRSVAKTMPEDMTGKQTTVSTPGKQFHGQEPLPMEEKPIYVVTYTFQNKKVEDTINTPEEAMEIIFKVLNTPGYELIGATKKIESQDIEEQF